MTETSGLPLAAVVVTICSLVWPGVLAGQQHFGPSGASSSAFQDSVPAPAPATAAPPTEPIPFAPKSVDPWRNENSVIGTARSGPAGFARPVPGEEVIQEGAETSFRYSEVEHLSNGISPRIDYLLWRARRRALDFAIVDPNDNGVPEGPVVSNFYDTDSGIRFGFAFALPGPEWELAAFYTYFHAHGNQTFTAPPGGVVHATLLSPVGPRQVTGAFSQANVDLDVVDIQFGPRLTVGDDFLINFFGGIRLGQIKMRQNAFYTGGDTGGFDEFLSFSGSRSLGELRFRGLGIRVGTEGAWRCAEYTHLFARGSLSLLSGRYSESLLQDEAGEPFVNLAEKWEQVVPVLETAVGISYEFREDMRLAVGYEFSHWLGLVDSVHLSDDVAVGKTSRRRSDLTFEGLFVQLAIFF